MMQASTPSSGSIRHTLLPIVNIHSGEFCAFEIKQAQLKDNSNLLEDMTSQRALLIRKLEFFQKLSQQDSNLYRALFFDMSMQILDVSSVWKDLIPFVFHFRVNVCLKMQSVIDELSDIALNNIVKLKGVGVRFWVIIDDEWSSVNISKNHYPYHSYVDG